MPGFMQFRSAICAAAFVFGVGAARAGIVNFDDLAAGTRISTQYVSQGVAFGNPQTTSFIANSDLQSSFPNSSGPNVAFFYPVRGQSVDDRKANADAENDARAARRGLSADVEPTPPWEYRKAKREP